MVFPFGIDDEFSLGQELVGHVGGGLEVSSAVALEVEDQLFHPLSGEAGHGFVEFAAGGGREVIQADVAGLGVHHVGDIKAVGRDDVADDVEIDQSGRSSPEHGNLYFGPFRSFELLHHLVIGDFSPGHQRVVDLHDAVAGADPDFLRGSA